MPFPNTQAAINALLQIWLVKIDDHAALYGLNTDAIIYAHRGIFLKNNKPVGQYSDVMTVFTMP